MKQQKLLFYLFMFLTLALGGCGGGGGGGTTGTPSGGGPVQQTGIDINGVVSKGPLKGATVTIYAANPDGTKGSQLATTTTLSDGSYATKINGYTGVVLIEATGGAYTDEATNTPNVTLAIPLRTAVSATGSALSAAVTPLTEIAVQKMGATMTSANVQAMNTLVSSLYLGGKNIVTTQPVDVSNPGSATDDQKSYALILAAVSEKIQASGGTLATVLTTLTNAVDTTNQTLTDPAVITAPLSQFLASPGVSNNTGITTVTSPSLVKIVTQATVKLTISSLPTATLAAGVDLVLTLPAGVAPRSLTGTDASASAVMVGTAANGSISGASYNAATRELKFLGITAQNGFGAGEFLDISCTVDPNAQVSASDFLVTYSLIDTNGVTIPGAQVTKLVIFK